MYTFADLVLFFQGHGEEPLGACKDLLLQLPRDLVSGDLEEAIVEAAIAHVLDQLGLGFFVVSVEDYYRQRARLCAVFNVEAGLPEKSRIGGGLRTSPIFPYSEQYDLASFNKE